jgi:site-specific DNA-methyltransferase (adenine-specific)
MDQHQINLFSSKKSDDWGTPVNLYNTLNDEFNFTFDPCPFESPFNGLLVPWIGNIFVNPPYSNINSFLIKAHEELKNGNAKVIVFLVFANTDTGWFHDYVLGKCEIRFLRGRVHFTGHETKGHAAMRPSILCIFRGVQFVK